MSIYKISLSDAQADKLADWLAHTTGEVDSRVAEEIRAQIPKPAIAEPSGNTLVEVFGLIYKRQDNGEWWPLAGFGSGYEWPDLVAEWRRGREPAPVVYRNEVEASPYEQGREDFANAMRRDVSGLLADAITAERRDAYDKVLASIAALLGES